MSARRHSPMVMAFPENFRPDWGRVWQFFEMEVISHKRIDLICWYSNKEMLNMRNIACSTRKCQAVLHTWSWSFEWVWFYHLQPVFFSGGKGGPLTDCIRGFLVPEEFAKDCGEGRKGRRRDWDGKIKRQQAEIWTVGWGVVEDGERGLEKPNIPPYRVFGFFFDIIYISLLYCQKPWFKFSPSLSINQQSAYFFWEFHFPFPPIPLT